MTGHSTLWHPHTDRPIRICSCLIATPPANDGDCWALAGGNYIYDPRTDTFRDEMDDEVLQDTVFFWAYETDVLHELDPAPLGAAA